MDGKLIVFEGVEGSGKSTQLRRLQHWLKAASPFQQLQAQGVIPKLVITREPGGTTLGRSIRSLLLDSQSAVAVGAAAELLLYAADRAQHVEEVILPALQSGNWVLCDRFVDSTIAYQGYGRGLSLDLIAHINQIATQGLAGHLTLWLQLEVAIGLARSQSRGPLDRMEQTDLAFHRRVQQGFEALAQQHPNRIVAINAACSERAVAEQIQAVIAHHLQQWYAPHLNPC